MALAPLVAGWGRHWPHSLAGPLGTKSDITFPTTNLRLITRIALGADLSADPSTWLWEEITPWVRWDDGNGIRIDDGRRDQSSRVTTTTATMMLDNRDGRFSRRNPNSPYYGLLSTNTPIWVQADPGDGGHTRLEAFVNSWPTRWRDKSLNDSYVQISCAGMLRRLQQSPGDSHSAIYRAALTSAPVAYWPLEDRAGSTSAASAIGGKPMRLLEVVGTIGWGQVSDLAGSAPNPAIADGSAFGDVAGGSATAWHVEFFIKAAFNSGGVARVYADSDDVQVFRVFLPSAAGQAVSVIVGDSEEVTVDTLTGSAVAASFENTWHHIGITATQSGADVAANLYVDGVLEDTVVATSVTMGRVTQFWANHAANVDVTSMGHILVGDTTTLSGVADAMDGYDGEQAHVRIARLFAEDGVRYTSDAVTSQIMGPQPVGTLLPLVQECESVDHGVLFEHNFGMAYKSLDERYNQPVALALDFAQGHITTEPQPADDNQRTVNKQTVYRSGGSSATAEETEGPMGTGAEGPGVFEGSPVTVNVGTDTQLPGQASWLVHLGTVDEDRWPQIEFGLHHSPELIDDWTALNYGARTQVANPPEEGPRDTIDALIEGHTERMNQRLWDVAVTTSPASPYNVGVYGPTAGAHRYGAAGSELAAEFDAGTDTSMSVATTKGQLWTTTSARYPLDIRCGGVVLEVTAVSGASSPQTFTITQTPVNGVVKTIPVGTPVTLATPCYYGL